MIMVRHGDLFGGHFVCEADMTVKELGWHKTVAMMKETQPWIQNVYFSMTFS